MKKVKVSIDNKNYFFIVVSFFTIAQGRNN